MSKTNSSKIYYLIILSAVAWLPSCQYAPGEQHILPVLSETDLPVVNMDPDHDFINLHTGNDNPLILGYKIAAGKGFVLNASGYKFQIPSDLAAFNITHPNRIHIYLKLGPYDSSSSLYYADWNNNETSIALTSQTLIPLQQIAKPFIGLESGQEATIVIGFFDKSGQTTNGAELFYPFWGGSVYVQ